MELKTPPLQHPSSQIQNSSFFILWRGSKGLSNLPWRKHTNSESLSEKIKQRSSGHEKPKEREYETFKEQRRQEKYRKSELIDQENNRKQEEPKENAKSAIKSKSEENQKIQNNRKEPSFDFPTLFDNLRESGKQEVEIKTVYRSDNKGGVSEEETVRKDNKMLRENEIGLSQGLVGMSHDSINGSEDEYIDGEDFDNEIDILVSLHDDDCISDCTEDDIKAVLESFRSEQEMSDEQLNLSDPCKPFFGASELKNWARFLPESEIECPEDEVKEFICSYMYEYLRSVDSQTIQDVDDKWIEDCDELKMDFSRVKHHQSQITELLLISPLFTTLDDHFGLAESVPFLYDMLKQELSESYDFIFSKENIPDIYNSQEELDSGGKEPTIDNEIKTCDVQSFENENISGENRDVLCIKSEIDSVNSGVEILENRSHFETNKDACGEEFETPQTEEPKTRNSLNPDAREFCVSADSIMEVFKMVTTTEASVENSSISPELDIQSNSFPTIYDTLKWSINDGQTKPQSQWDSHTVVRKCTTNGGEPSVLLSDKTVTTLAELLAPSKEDRQTIWTGVLKWTAAENKSRSSSCSVLISSKVKQATLNAGLWPQEMIMKLVPHDFIETIGFDTLCQLSNIVTFELAIGEDSESLSQDLSSEFAGFIAINTSAGMTCMVVIFFQNTCTYVGLVPHQCVGILSGMLADFCHQQSLANSQENKLELGVQTDAADYEVKLGNLAEENQRVKVECDEQKEKIATLSSTVESLQSQQGSLQFQIDAEKKACAEMANECLQHERKNVNLQEKLNDLEKNCRELEGKLLEQENKNVVLEARDAQYRIENEALKTTLARTEKLWEEDKDQIKIMTKKNELSEKISNKKIEAVEETNRALRNELNSNEDKFKQQLTILTEEKIAQAEKIAKLQEKLAMMEECRQELETSQDKLKAQENKHQEKLYAHVQDACNDATDCVALVIMECSKNRIEELKNLASAAALSGNTALLGEVDNWLKNWQSCYDEAEQRRDTLKTVYPGILEKLKSGEMVSFPKFNVNLPSQPQNIVEVFNLMNKKIPLLPMPMLVAHQNPSPFTGNSLCYSAYPSPPVYIPQQPGFAQIPQHVPMSAYSGNIGALPEPVPDHSSIRKPKAPFTALQNVRVNTPSIIDPVTGQDPFSVDKKPSTTQPQPQVESPPPLADASCVEPQEKKLNTASRLKKTIVQQSLASSTESSMSPTVSITTTSNSLVQLQALAKKVSEGIASTAVDTKAAATRKQVTVPKTPAVTNTTDSARAVPGPVRPVTSAVPFGLGPAKPAATAATTTAMTTTNTTTTTSSTKVIGAPVKLVTSQKSSATAPVNSSGVKPPSLLDLPLPKKLSVQSGKVQQNPKSKSHHYQKLIADLKKKYPNKSDEELAVCISIVRERNNNRLTGLPLPTIITMVGKVLQEQARKDGGSMGLDKFGTTAWQLKSAETVQWSKPKDTSEEECTICIEPLGTQTTTLHCNHSFHTNCIRPWLQNESVCPICRVYTRMVDEFPPLA